MNDIQNKIRALLAKTVENGCTEAEAFAALEKARALMDAYEISPEALELTKEEKAGLVHFDRRDPHKVRYWLAYGIAQFCDCEVWRNSTTELVFCGIPADRDFAGWLLDSLSQFVLTELFHHLMRNPVPGRVKKWVINSFVYGATSRINERMEAIKAASQQQVTSQGRALVVAKKAMVAECLKASGINLGKARSSRVAIESGAYAAGQSAGSRASFGRPVSGGSGALRIGN